MSKPTLLHYELMYKIRIIEEKLLDLFQLGKIRGTTHTYIGQEAIAVSALSCLKKQDMVISTHRSHGHFIAYSNDYEILVDEIFGLPEGVCHGLGGSQHLQFENFYSNGIVGGMVPVATGMALAEKLKGNDSIAVSFMGDGALGEGVVYETFNIASLWNIPVLYVIENNRYAQTTAVEANLAGSIKNRLTAFGIENNEIESNDIGLLLACFQEAFDYVRSERKPYCQIINTYRMGPHSKGDDFRDIEEIKLWQKKDPLTIAKKYYEAAELDELETRVDSEIEIYFANLLDRVDSDHMRRKAAYIESDGDLIPKELSFDAGVGRSSSGREILMVHHLNEVFHGLLESDRYIYFIGEDILDPSGGAFKVTQGLSTKFPDRLFTTPISEAGITGLANGMALRGLKPIVEIMFGDFTTLVVDQLINHASKFRRMYGHKVNCPIIVRAPMGGYRGYGPTHSQTLDKLFLGVPGLTVVACSVVHDQHLVWQRMLGLESPCFYIENKTIYGQQLQVPNDGKVGHFHCHATDAYFPTVLLKMTAFSHIDTDVLVITYGGMVPIAMDIARELYIEQEIVATIAVPAVLSPLPTDDLLSLVSSCNKVVVLEEGTERSNWGSEVAAFLLENVNQKISLRRCASQNTIIPNSVAGEEFTLPDRKRCYAVIEGIVNAI
jgi:2-oxoisovalerate dehydrogenase E1 component